MDAIRSYNDYKEIIQNKNEVIIKFYADWCPDCSALNHFIKPIMEEYRYLAWYELNRDEVPSAADENDVTGIPGLLIFKQGKKTAHLHPLNAKSPGDIRTFLKKQL
ncbi:thioredoxin family protein [Salinicoccus sp. YB14-2]|uniref:thioredoxin family protein n=1 Tax=Salinicoccus sp. YB14-2 TaxID=1572701 RepID=UPI00068F6A23|nr:thioredoxin family protein [Salinicoccus sp. YB14-2]